MNTQNLSLKKAVPLTRVSFIFAVLYWLLESLRDVIVFEEGTLIERIFYPDITSLLMRLLVVLLIILFGHYAQSFKESFEAKHTRETQSKTCISIIWIGFLFSGFYWFLDAIRDVFVYQKENIITQIFRPLPSSFWMRFMAVCVIMLFSLFVQNLFDKQKQMKESLIENNKKLKELDRMKSDFLSTVSHELRTPIAIMREGVSLCMSEKVGSLNPTQKKLLSDTQNSIDRLNRLVTDLLDLSRIEEGKIKLRRRSVDLCSLAKGIYDDYLPQAKKKEIRIKLELPDYPVQMYVDPDKVTQIFNNLLSNALRFTNAGGTINIGIQNGDTSVECYVSDTGIGISEEFIGKLFKKFEQIGRVDGPGYKGTGLGLSICKGLVEKHGGKIDIVSKQGIGSTVSFTLINFPFPKLLIVDDEQNIIDVVKSLLENEQYQFLEANTGEDAIEIARKEAPSLILLDMNLTHMSGYEVIGRLKHDGRTSNIPIIIMSAYSVDKERLGKIENLTAIPTIQKPFESGDLQNYIEEILIN